MKTNKIFDINTMGRDFAVGDIHGCYAQLEEQLELEHFDTGKDRLFSVGDIVDRGPDSESCLSLLNLPCFHMVRGNHEDMMCNSLLHGQDSRLWIQNGGEWAYKKEVDKEWLMFTAEYIEKQVPLTMTIKTPCGDIGICHAEPPSNNWNDVYSELDPIHKNRVLWGRSLVSYTEYSPPWECKNIGITIHGHTPVKEHTYKGNSLFIDTGSFIKEFGYYNGYPGVNLIRIDNILEK